jgi:hypothetical protein
MKRALVERNIVVALFVTVLVVFSFAERDSRKLIEFYNSRNTTEITTQNNITAEKVKLLVVASINKY